MLQFVFLRVKASVAAVKMDSSTSGDVVLCDVLVDEDDMASTGLTLEGMALGSWEEVLRAGPPSFGFGEGGGVGGAFTLLADVLDDDVWALWMERKFSRPLELGRRN